MSWLTLIWNALIWNLRVPLPSQKGHDLGTADLLRLAEKSSFLLYLSLRPSHQPFLLSDCRSWESPYTFQGCCVVSLTSWEYPSTPANSPPMSVRKWVPSRNGAYFCSPWICVEAVTHYDQKEWAEVMVVFLDFWAHKRPGSFLVLLEPSHHAMRSPSSMERSTWRTIEVLPLKC